MYFLSGKPMHFCSGVDTVNASAVIERNRSSFQDSLALIVPAFIHGKEPTAFQTRGPYAAPSPEREQHNGLVC
jgi:hypothetical protein